MYLSKSFKIVLVLVVVLVLGFLGFVFRAKLNWPNKNSQKEAANYFSVGGNNNQQPDNSQSQNQAPSFTAANGVYKNSQFGFTFNYQPDFTVGNLTDDASYTILLQNKDKKGIQILITPFDEDISLTAERIHQDVPDLEMQQQKTVTVGGVPAVAFLNPKGVLGKTREVWFVHKGSLYQIVSTPDFDQTLAAMLITWKFN